jgi:hypothetical protein
MCTYRTPGSVVVDAQGEITHWTDLLLVCYNMRKITRTIYHAAANGVIERRNRPIAEALSILAASSDGPKEMWIDHHPAVLWGDEMTFSHTTGSSQFRLRFGQDIVHPIAVKRLTWNNGIWIRAIDDTASLISKISSFPQKHPGVPDGSDGSDKTSYSPTQN